MKQIIPPNRAVLKVLGGAKDAGAHSRFATFCLSLDTPDGVLLLNVLTRELLLLSPDEYASGSPSSYLKEHWFLVPEESRDHEYVSMVRWVLQNYRRGDRPLPLVSYTILTTTDCNARCFYCYENGCNKISMDPDTAHRTAQYIQKNCGGKKVTLTWFGGEPLVNPDVIDLICNDLKAAGVPYASRIVSNGYLFCGDLLQRAKSVWNIEKAQIAMDGTEKVYNRSKAYVYKEDSSPYQTVLKNVEALLNAEIDVQIRLNISPLNADDLISFADELHQRFPETERLTVYSHPLFDFSPNSDQKESRQKLFAAQAKLENHLLELGLSKGNVRPLRRSMKLSHCMADSSTSIIIMPDGKLGLCELHVSDEYIGHIDSPELDTERIQSWKERGRELPECKTCFFHPECTSLKKCTGSDECSEHRRHMRRQMLEQCMLLELRQWKTQNQE